MQILPFVSIFMILLAGIAYTFFDKSKIFREETHVAISYTNLQRKLARKLHQEAFKAIPKKPSQEQTLPVHKETPAYTSPREGASSKFNLFPLLTCENHPVGYELFVRYLTALYQEPLLSSPHFQSLSLKEFSKELLHVGRAAFSSYTELNKDPTILSLIDLYPQGLLSHHLFYKMLKGTHGSYPPLSSYFTLNAENSFLLHFPSLSPWELEVLFGKEIAQAILEKETALYLQAPEKKPQTLSQGELSSLLNERHFSSSFYEKMIASMDFTQKRNTRHTIMVYDPSTHVSIEREKS